MGITIRDIKRALNEKYIIRVGFEYDPGKAGINMVRQAAKRDPDVVKQTKVGLWNVDFEVSGDAEADRLQKALIHGLKQARQPFAHVQKIADVND